MILCVHARLTDPTRKDRAGGGVWNCSHSSIVGGWHFLYEAIGCCFLLSLLFSPPLQRKWELPTEYNAEIWDFSTTLTGNQRLSPLQGQSFVLFSIEALCSFFLRDIWFLMCLMFKSVICLRASQWRARLLHAAHGKPKFSSALGMPLDGHTNINLEMDCEEGRAGLPAHANKIATK